MRYKNFIICLFLFWIHFSFGQSDLKLSIDFKDSTLEEALLKLESRLDLKIYFQNEWLSDKKINKTYSNKDLGFILNDLLESTSLNYLIYDNRIILTNNSIVHTTLPYGFFNKDSIATHTTSNQKTLFINSTDHVKIIGKQSKDGQTSYYSVSGYAINENTQETDSKSNHKCKKRSY